MSLYTAGDVMDDAAVLLNDAVGSLYSYTVQLPFLRMVMRELESKLRLNGSPLTLKNEIEILVTAGDDALSLPSDFFIPIRLSEKSSSDTLYTKMTPKANVGDLEIVPNTTLSYWDYRESNINFIPATADRQVKLEYYKFLDEIVDEDSLSEVASARNYLAHTTASKCARYIGKNREVANDLLVEAGDMIDTLISQEVKNNQSLRTRRRPFRMGYRSARIVS
jgi:hypothetical protein